MNGSLSGGPFVVNATDRLETMPAKITDLLVPEVVDGAPTFVPYREDIQRLLKEGDPTIDWVGDPRLYVQPRKGAEGFAVGRLNEDGTHSLVCVSQPPHVLDKDLLIYLRDRDTRFVDVLGNVEKNNEQVRKEADEHLKDRVKEAYERTVHGLVKDTGHHY